ncbi:hypothetical protein Tco_0490266 [Tanacetum coccineum]
MYMWHITTTIKVSSGDTSDLPLLSMDGSRIPPESECQPYVPRGQYRQPMTYERRIDLDIFEERGGEQAAIREEKQTTEDTGKLKTKSGRPLRGYEALGKGKYTTADMEGHECAAAHGISAILKNAIFRDVHAPTVPTGNAFPVSSAWLALLARYTNSPGLNETPRTLAS